MKHNWKRLFSVVLTLALVFTLLAPVAGASEKRADGSRFQALELSPVDAGTLDCFRTACSRRAGRWKRKPTV